jgi:copper chaperone CopZ
MAMQEGQGKVIAIVSLSVLWIGTAVAAYMFFKDADEARAKAASAAKAEQEAKGQLATSKKEYGELKELVFGSTADKDHAAVKTQLGGMLTAPQLSPERLLQKKTIDTMVDGITYLSKSLTEADGRIKELEAGKQKVEEDLKGVKGIYQTEVNVAKQAAAKAEEDKKAEVSRLMAELDSKTAEVDAIQRRLGNATQQLEQSIKNSERAAKESVANIGSLTRQLDSLKEQEERRKEIKFEVSDGKITELQDGGRLAYITIGSESGVEHGTTFGVYGHDSGGNPYQYPKATIEVIRIIDRERSLCRVSRQKVEDPVLPGDEIFNPIWSPGEKAGVAFVGLINLDADGKEDNDEFRKLVERMGGKVDAFAAVPSGKVIGKITSKTAWLIDGDIPDPEANKLDNSNTVLNKNLTDARNTMLEQARNLGVRVINVNNFLTYMGHNAPDNLVANGEEDRVRRRKMYKPKLELIEDRLNPKKKPGEIVPEASSGKTP